MHEFDAWLDYAFQKAQSWGPDQTDASRVRWSCMSWASTLGINVNVPHAGAAKTNGSDHPVGVYRKKGFKTKTSTSAIHSTFVTQARAQFPWIDALCACFLTLQGARVPKQHSEVLYVLTRLKNEAYLDLDAMMDAMIDYDTCRDLIIVLRQALDEIKDHLVSGSGT